MIRVCFLLGLLCFLPNSFAKNYYIPLKIGNFTYESSSVFSKYSKDVTNKDVTNLVPRYSMSNFQKRSLSTLLKTSGYNIGLIGISFSKDFELEASFLFQQATYLKTMQGIREENEEIEDSNSVFQEDTTPIELIENVWDSGSKSSQKKHQNSSVFSKKTKQVPFVKNVRIATKMRHTTFLGKTTLLHLTPHFNFYNVCGIGYLKHFEEEDAIVFDSADYLTAILGIGLRYKINTYLVADISYFGTIVKYNLSKACYAHQDKDMYLKAGINLHFY